MGNAFFKEADEKQRYLKSPDLGCEDTQAVVSELVSEIGRHSYAGIVSIGPVGVGKSSNLNTIASYMSNRLEQQAASGTGTSSLTNESVAHLITYQGRPVKWKWMDTPGDLFTDLVEQWKRTKLPADVEEHMSMEAYEAVLQEMVISPLRAHHIGCVMAFLSAQELASQSLRTDAGGAVKLRIAPQSRLSYHLQVLKDLYRRLVQQGLRMVCIVTKVDLIDPRIEADTVNVVFSSHVHHLRQFVSAETGMPANQVHPVVNLVRDFDPQDNFPLGHLALFNVRCALAAARHCELSPPAPGSVPTGAGMEWDTLSFPSRITSEDGMSGRSHPVGSVAAGFPAAEALNSNAKSVAGSQATDIDAELMREGSELNA